MGTGWRGAPLACVLFVLAGLFTVPMISVRAAGTDVTGPVAVNTTWDPAGSPYRIVGDVFVTANSTLRILPGVEVNVTGPFGLSVGEGASLSIEGNASAPVSFFSNTSAWWTGITLNSTAAPSRISNATVEEAQQGLVVNGTAAVLEDVEFRRNRYGVVLQAAQGVTIRRGVFRWNDIAGIHLRDGSRGNLVDLSLFEGNNASWQGGMYLESSGGGNVVSHSTFRDQETALGLEATNASDPDRFFANNFAATVRDNTGLGVWNASYSVGGNYWTDFGEPDARSGPAQADPGPDGVSDAARRVTGAWATPLTEDRYPRMCERLDAYPVPIVDLDPPVVQFLAPSPREFPQSVTAEASIDDAHRCHRGGYLRIEAPDATFTNQSLDPSGLNFTRTLVPSLLGLYRLDLWAPDAAGNMAHAAATVLVEDTSPPVVTSLVGTVEWQDPWTMLVLSASVTDNFGLASVTGNLSGPEGSGPIAPALENDRYVHRQGIRYPGAYNYCFSAEDLLGQSAAACDSTSFVDTMPPTLSAFLISPSTGEVGASVDVSVRVWDNSIWDPPVVHVLGPGGWTNRTMALVGGSEYSAVVAPPLVGTYDVEVTVQDISGNTAAVNGTFDAVDTTPPQAVTVVVPHARVGEPVLLDGSGTTDFSGIASASWNFTHQGSPVVLPGLAPTFAFLEEGAYTLGFSAADPYGNVATATESLLVEVDDPPGVAVSLSATAPEAGDAVLINATVTEDFAVAEVWAVVDGPTFSENGTMSEAGPGQYLRWTTAGSLGRHNVTVWARDSLGQWASGTAAFDPVDTTPPTVPSIAASLYQRRGGNELTLEVTASDNDRVASVLVEVRAENGSVVARAFLPPYLGDTWRDLLVLRAAGNLTVCATATDRVGLNGSRCQAFDLADTYAPFLLDAFLLPSPADVGAPVTLDLVADDNVGLAAVWVNLTSPTFVPLVPFEANGSLYRYRYVPADLGPHTLTATAVDLSGLRSSLMVNFIAVDLSAPVADAGPDQSVALGAVAFLDGTASTDNVGIVNHTWEVPPALGGGVRYGPLASVPASRRGAFEIVLRARDATGLESSDSVLLTVYDDAPPAVLDLSLPAVVPFPQPIPIAVNVTDNDAVAGVSASVSGASGSFTLVLTGLGNGTWAAAFVPSAPGEHEVNVTAVDLTGLRTSLTRNTTSLDARAPDLALYVPAQVALFSQVPAQVAASDDDGVASVRLSVLDPAGGTRNVTLAYALGIWSGDIVYDVVGTHRLTATATDRSGNENTTAKDVLVVDSVLPVVSALDAPANVTLGASASFTATVSDNYDGPLDLQVRLEIEQPDGADAVVPLAPAFGAFSGAFTATQDGAHGYRVVATDRAGNEGSLSGVLLVERVVVLDLQPPQVFNLTITTQVMDASTSLNASFGVTDDIGVVQLTAELFGPGVVPPARLSLPPGGLVLARWNVTAGGTYEVRITARDAAGHETVAQEYPAVASGAGPLAAAGPDVTLAPGGSVTFDARNSTDDFGIVNYTWVFRDGPLAVALYGITATYAFDRPGTYVVTLVVKDAAGRTGQDVMQVHVDGPETPGDSAAIPVILLIVALGVVGVIALLRVLSDRRRKKELEEELDEADSEVIADLDSPE